MHRMVCRRYRARHLRSLCRISRDMRSGRERERQCATAHCLRCAAAWQWPRSLYLYVVACRPCRGVLLLLGFRSCCCRHLPSSHAWTPGPSPLSDLNPIERKKSYCRAPRCLNPLAAYGLLHNTGSVAAIALPAPGPRAQTGNCSPEASTPRSTSIKKKKVLRNRLGKGPRTKVASRHGSNIWIKD